MTTLLTNWHSIDKAFRNVDYYITPVLNPDGYEFSHNHERFWRLNRRKLQSYCFGVDLNRNFPYKWLEFKDPLGWEAKTARRACSEVYAGLAPSSEPETKAVTSFITQFPNKFKVKLYFVIDQSLYWFDLHIDNFLGIFDLSFVRSRYFVPLRI